MHLRLLLVIATALAVIAFHADGASADDPAVPPLFVAATSRSATVPGDETVMLSRAVTVRLDLLPAAGEARRRVRLDLFGPAFVADLAPGMADGSSRNWQGIIEGIDGSFVSLTSVADAVAGTITMPGAVYRLAPGAGGVQLIEELDPRAFALDGPPVPVDPSPTSSEANASTSSGGPIIDVLVVYTSAARVGAGGTAGITATIAEGIAETNTAYANSRITQRVRLANATEVAYVESESGSAELTRLRDPADGYLDNVQALRDQYGADLVVLIDENLNNPPECGRAFEMSTLGPSFATSAFAVVKRTCITGQYSFAHEMGHNMGASHDRPTGCAGAYSYSCGYQDPSGQFRTMMAYDCPASCPRVLYFSNPAVTYLGLPTGVAAALPNAADNATTLNNTASIVANFRPSILGVALAFSTMPGVMTPGAGFPVQVVVRNSAGAIVVVDQATVVTLSVGIGTGTVSCAGAAVRTVTNGVATFTNCTVSANGLYQLVATADLPMTPAASAAIVVGAGYRLPVPLVASDTGGSG